MRTSIAVSLLAAVVFPGLVSAKGIVADGQAEDTPTELQQFGQFIGTWKCTSFSRGRDKSWQPNPWENTWTWYWVLDGHAIQDVWVGSPDSPPGWNAGTNIRIYDEAAQRWRMAWTTTLSKQFDFYEAEPVDGNMVMQGDIPARGQRPAHSARITFHEITDTSFSWKYEAAMAAQPESYAEQARLQCRRSES